jgi:hypothetical protein
MKRIVNLFVTLLLVNVLLIKVSVCQTVDFIPKYASGGTTNSIIKETDSKIGINTENPQATLDVNGDIFTSGYLSANQTLSLRASNSMSSLIYFGPSLRFFTTEQSHLEPMSLDGATGKVVINYLLSTNGFRLNTGAGVNKFLVSDERGNGSWVPISEFNDNTWIRTENDDLISNCKHNVGIGIEVPTKKLDVEGDFALSGGIYGRNRNESNSLQIYGGSNEAGGLIELGNGATHEYNFVKIFGKGDNGEVQLCSGPRTTDPCLIVRDRKVGIGIESNQADLFVTGNTIINQRVGIGTTNPTRALDVNGDIALIGAIYGKPSNKNYNKLQLFGSSNTDAGYIELGDGSSDTWKCVKLLAHGENASLQFYAGDDWKMMIKSDKVVVGNSDKPVDLKVNGKVLANEVKVSLESWSDYVFSNDYKLRPLQEVQDYISLNKHLPDVPSQKEVLENGVNVGEMNSLLLKKIEELTLYVLELKKENDSQQLEITNLKKSNQN